MKDQILSGIHGINEIVEASLGGILDFIDDRKVVRRVIVVVTAYLLVDAYLWAKHFAESAVLTGAELGLVIAAVLVPITTLQGMIFKMYDNSRQKDG